MRKLALCLLMLTLALPASTADYYHLRDHVTNTYGSALSGVYVYIYDPPNQTTTTATAYTDLAGGTAVTYPLTTDSNGMFECYLASGNYDINVVHSGHNIDDTWDNYMVGAAASIDSLGSYACVDTLKSCSDDTVHVRASDGARHGTLKVNQLLLENALGHDNDKASITFGPYASGTDNINARIYLPYYGVFYMTRPGYNIRVPQMDGTTYTGHSALGIGGTEGVATNWQFWEDVHLTWAHPRADSAAATGGRYQERPVISFHPRLSEGDGVVTDYPTTVDTLRCDAYQALNITNDRGGRLRWLWAPRSVVGDTLHGAIGGYYGTPDYAIKLRTDLPDSSGSSRDAVQIQWTMTPNSGQIRDSGSSFLTMLEHNSQHYVFARDALELRPGKNTATNKTITFYGSDSKYTKLKMQDDESAFSVYTTNRLLTVYDYDGSDDARFKVSRVFTDSLKVKTGTDMYIRSSTSGHADLHVDTLHVNNVTVSSDLNGARVWLPYSHSVNDATVDAWLYCGQIQGNTTNLGAPVMVDGSIKGGAVRYNIDSYTPGAYAVARLYINGNATVAVDSFYIDATGYYGEEIVFTRGTYPFSAGDFIAMQFDVNGTLQYDKPIVMLDLQLDE